jgi:hypothetical protein
LKKSNLKIVEELDTVYIISDGRKFLKYVDALYWEGELQSGIERKIAENKKTMDVIEKIIKVLRTENWGIYYKNQPMKHLEMQDGDSLYQVNQVDEVDFEEAISKALTKGESWESSQTNSDQNKNSMNG